MHVSTFVNSLLDERKPLTLMVKGCARCGLDHYVSFYEFQGQPIEDNKYWGMCPETVDPVLMKFVEDDNNKD